MAGKTNKIGGASGYWGESAMATPQLLNVVDLDYLVYDYLAEITMSILARAKAKDASKGYATDFVDFVIKPFLPTISARGVKLIANAGGVNPESCAEAVRALIKERNLNLKVGVVTGDNLMDKIDEIAKSAPPDMFSGAPFPNKDKVASVNAYLGAFPIAKALEMGADIIITGRCVDSAVTLGACIYEFGWEAWEWDKLASGSLAGHIIECGPQATGGNFTDWEDAGDISNIGYPIAEIKDDGSFVLTKPINTGGVVNVGTVSEQMLYEIGDPQNYLLPDVTCDFSDVEITKIGNDRVEVSAAKGRPAPGSYKTCLTYMDGYRAGSYASFYGERANEKAEKFAKAALTRAEKTLRLFNLGEFTEFSQETMGAGSQSGLSRPADEVIVKLAVKHPDVRGAGIFLKELAGMGLATPPGLSGFTGVRGKPSPVLRLFSYLTPKGELLSNVEVEGKSDLFLDAVPPPADTASRPRMPDDVSDAEIDVPLIKLAWGRSGDKGNKANIGIIARKPEYMPYIWAGLTDDFIGETYAHFMDDEDAILRYYLPGSHAMNILIDNILGGGGAASLRNDAQGKGYAQLLLAKSIKVSKTIAEALE